MFNYNQLKKVHIEISNRCQASCPMCPRNIHGGINNPLIKSADWTLEDFKKIFSLSLLNQVDSISFCGTFGDPMMNNDLIAMCEYIKSSKPGMNVHIHTNGSARNPAWWKQLAGALPARHEIVFALDGLEDTQHIYRVGTNFKKIIKNAQAVIDAGGRAVWMFIRFKHNEHQVEEAKTLSKDLGFAEFVLKNTRRFASPNFAVLNKNGEWIYDLKQPSDSIIKFVDRRDVENFKQWPNATDIKCFALDDEEIYIDANFTVMPCCILAAFLYTNYNEALLRLHGLYDASTSMVHIGSSIQKQVYEIVEELGGLDKLDAKTVGVKSIVDSDKWQTIWKEKWATNTSTCCTVMCSSDSPFIKLEEQVVRDV
jgi:MoaA/NifB/PqqE/SkfB family radical SAM enzyme